VDLDHAFEESAFRNTDPLCNDIPGQRTFTAMFRRSLASMLPFIVLMCLFLKGHFAAQVEPDGRIQLGLEGATGRSQWIQTPWR
jgi:hypothetical protein